MSRRRNWEGRRQRSGSRHHRAAHSEEEPGLLDVVIDLIAIVVKAIWNKVFPGKPREQGRSERAARRESPAAKRRERWQRIERISKQWEQELAQRPRQKIVFDRSVCAPAPPALPYRRQEHLVSQGERAFWYPLHLAVKGKYRIFHKVRLADVITAPPGSDEKRWFDKICAYHVDFVLCAPDTTAPLVVIELDDRSHDTASQRDRDGFKDQALNAAGIPVYRVPAQEAYDPAEIWQAIATRLNRF